MMTSAHKLAHSRKWGSIHDSFLEGTIQMTLVLGSVIMDLERLEQAYSAMNIRDSRGNKGGHSMLRIKGREAKRTPCIGWEIFGS